MRAGCRNREIYIIEITPTQVGAIDMDKNPCY